MKFVSILALVLILASISLFGFLGMEHSHRTAGNFYNCLAAAVHGGASCPENWLSEIEFHFSALQFFSLAIINLISFAGAGRLLLLFIRGRSGLDLATVANFGIIRNSFFHPISQISFIAWLSFHENSPALLMGRF